ncbi:hypothetical protein BT63DRAFT_476026 [Microthyrium microscopicum]|uniref:Uncharacterized protein n=1 Tax=Microthyrium microscopicum TaxID=703497 RepID=A0A6A6UML2_9PEZI|nr:hypothetical protein BT63DRAFT_476026 [Microthyrium microscopicum]
MNRFTAALFLLFAILSLITLSTAASATSFCKCTCFANSTLIQLDGRPKSAPGQRNGDGSPNPTKGHGTCIDCNKKFCMDYNLPICKGAAEEDVAATCFQRDSAKDEAVVFIFIFATVGLLAYASVRPYAEKWLQNMRERRSYEPVSTNAAEES